MKIKPGVSLLGAKPELAIACVIIESVMQRHGQELVLTSVVDGKHSRGSLHYLGVALDARSRFFSEVEQQSVLADLRESLGHEFDVVLESNHYHIEFQPKKGVNQ